jgi:hypothetical protein
VVVPLFQEGFGEMKFDVKIAKDIKQLQTWNVDFDFDDDVLFLQ